MRKGTINSLNQVLYGDLNAISSIKITLFQKRPTTDSQPVNEISLGGPL